MLGKSRKTCVPYHGQGQDSLPSIHSPLKSFDAQTASPFGHPTAPPVKIGREGDVADSHTNTTCSYQRVNAKRLHRYRNQVYRGGGEKIHQLHIC